MQALARGNGTKWYGENGGKPLPAQTPEGVKGESRDRDASKLDAQTREASTGRGDVQETIVAQTPESSQGRARDVVAQKFGVGSNYVSRAERVRKQDASSADSVRDGRC